MAGIAELKARPPYAILARGAWSRGRVDERNVIVIDDVLVSRSYRSCRVSNVLSGQL